MIDTGAIALRRPLVGLLLFGQLGAIVELVLLRHYHWPDFRR